MKMLQLYIFCSVVTIVAGGSGFFFNIPTQCDLRRTSGYQTDCYSVSGGCPPGTSRANFGCTKGWICCEGEPNCIGIDCGNNGTCVDDVCICDHGFTGSNCETDLCDELSTSCSGNSICYRLPPPQGFNCTCDDGFSGPFCDQIDCGFEAPSPRLLNPDQDTKGSNPWVVRFVIDSFVYCTGVIVADQYVVTDLMCALSINKSGRPGDVFIGDHNVTAVDDTETVYEIVEMHFHVNAPTLNYTEAVILFLNNFDSLLAENIVLIKLNDTVTMGHGVNKACPPKPRSDYGCDPICKVSAFGTSDPFSYLSPPPVRQVLPATLTYDEVCKHHRRLDLPAATKCGLLLKDNSGICFNDNGGALVCQDEATLKWSLQGILLFRPASEDGTLCSDGIFLYSDVYTLWPDITPLMI